MMWLNGRNPFDRWFAPARPLGRLYREAPWEQRVAAFPALNVWEDGDNIHAEAELPGVLPDDLTVSVSGNQLTLKGARKPCDEQGVAYHRRERANLEFSRTVTLACEIDHDKVEAHMRDGVLTLALPKSTEAQARKIEAKVA